jgi:hypothetical protein
MSLKNEIKKENEILSSIEKVITNESIPRTGKQKEAWNICILCDENL